MITFPVPSSIAIPAPLRFTKNNEISDESGAPPLTVLPLNSPLALMLPATTNFSLAVFNPIPIPTFVFVILNTHLPAV